MSGRILPVAMISAVVVLAAAQAEAASPKRVLEACIGAANPKINGSYVVNAGLDASGQYARIEAGPSVSPQMAHAINQCANANGGNTGRANVESKTAGEVVNEAWQWANETAGLTTEPTRGRAISAYARQTRLAEQRGMRFTSHPACERRSPILYGGQHYCFYNR